MRRTSILTAIVLATLVALALNPGASVDGAGEGFKVDPVHSCIIYRIKYSSMASLYGRFNEFSGTVTVDESKLENTRCDLTVKATSVDSGSSRRDDHLRSPDFFSAKQHPEIRFVAKEAKKTGDNTLQLTGDLTLRGVTKEVTAEVTYGGQKPDRRGGTRVGFDASFTVNREDFGITYGGGMLGSDVTILMGLTATKE